MRRHISPALFTALLCAAVPPAFAQDSDDSIAAAYEEEFDFLVEGERNAARLAEIEQVSDQDFDVYADEEEEFADFELRPRGPSKAPRLPFTLAGKRPLADNYPAEVIFSSPDAVVVELPVLLARSRADFQGETYWLVNQVFVAGRAVAESRQLVSAAAISQSGPTIAFVKMLVPVEELRGELEVRVSRCADVADEPELLFSQSVSYTLQ